MGKSTLEELEWERHRERAPRRRECRSMDRHTLDLLRSCAPCRTSFEAAPRRRCLIGTGFREAPSCHLRHHRSHRRLRCTPPKQVNSSARLAEHPHRRLVLLPVAAPVLLPVAAPVLLPVAAPVLLPVAAPVLLPVAAPEVVPLPFPCKRRLRRLGPPASIHHQYKVLDTRHPRRAVPRYNLGSLPRNQLPAATCTHFPPPPASKCSLEPMPRIEHQTCTAGDSNRRRTAHRGEPRRRSRTSRCPRSGLRKRRPASSYWSGCCRCCFPCCKPRKRSTPKSQLTQSASRFAWFFLPMCQPTPDRELGQWEKMDRSTVGSQFPVQHHFQRCAVLQLPPRHHDARGLLDLVHSRQEVVSLVTLDLVGVAADRVHGHGRGNAQPHAGARMPRHGPDASEPRCGYRTRPEASYLLWGRDGPLLGCRHPTPGNRRWDQAAVLPRHHAEDRASRRRGADGT
jgi:hypothetical protein